MKNKRKYEDAAPASAAEISQKNLKKLKKFSKTDSPEVKEIKDKASEFLADRKNANFLIDILGHLDLAEPGAVATAAVQAVKRIFVALLEKNQIKKVESKSESPSAEEQYTTWVYERYAEGMKKMAELIHHRKTSVAHLAVATVMNIIQCQHWSNAKTKAKDWDSEDIRLLQHLVLGFCSNRTSGKLALSRFQEFLEYSDVTFHFISIMGRLVSKAAKTEKVNSTFVDNVITCLEMFEMPDKEKFEKCPVFLGAQKKDDLSPGSRLDHAQLRKHFGTVWISILTCKFNLDQYKRTLILLNEKVIPLLPRPLLLTDYLLSCYKVGGAISMLALSGVFTLMTKYNLEFPDFYAKLYELFSVEIFYVKYKARFFHLSDVFLSSTHLPENLVAAFAKRLARISLQAPAECLPMCIRFIHNLMHRHRGLTVLIDSPERSDLQSDPFLPDEKDPMKTRAMESSLWEIKSLASHMLPEVSSAAKDLVDKGVREVEKDVSAALETTPTDLMNIELKKKVFVNVPLNWEPPDGLKFQKNDFMSELIAIS